jgi:hypothetical protein
MDLDRLERNVRAMADLAAGAGVAQRPHTKSHKTAAIAQRQLAAGARGVTVAKLDEAEAYLAVGIGDVFVANQVAGPRKWARAAALQERGTVSLGVDSLEAARGLAAAASARGDGPVLSRLPPRLYCPRLHQGAPVSGRDAEAAGRPWTWGRAAGWPRLAWRRRRAWTRSARPGG